MGDLGSLFLVVPGSADGLLEAAQHMGQLDPETGPISRPDPT